MPGDAEREAREGSDEGSRGKERVWRRVRERGDARCADQGVLGHDLGLLDLPAPAEPATSSQPSKRGEGSTTRTARGEGTAGRNAPPVGVEQADPRPLPTAVAPCVGSRERPGQVDVHRAPDREAEDDVRALVVDPFVLGHQEPVVPGGGLRGSAWARREGGGKEGTDSAWTVSSDRRLSARTDRTPSLAEASTRRCCCSGALANRSAMARIVAYRNDDD